MLLAMVGLISMINMVLVATTGVLAQDDISVALNCAHKVTFYADGVEIKQDDNWFTTEHFKIPAETMTLAIECDNYGSHGGIIASFGDGGKTDTTWKCSGTHEDNWTSNSFDDSSWSPALDIGANGAHLCDIDPDAHWIWAGPDQKEHSHVFCRKSRFVKTAVTCDNTMKFYADGEELGSNDAWTVTSYYSVPVDTQVYAIECIDLGGAAGILASVGENLVKTDNSWKCSNKLECGWTSPDFDDSQWTSAYEIGNNGMEPWKTRHGISNEAKWIWTGADTWNGGDLHVYCRRHV